MSIKERLNVLIEELNDINYDNLKGKITYLNEVDKLKELELELNKQLNDLEDLVFVNYIDVHVYLCQAQGVSMLSLFKAINYISFETLIKKFSNLKPTILRQYLNRLVENGAIEYNFNCDSYGVNMEKQIKLLTV